jgi:ParB family chromosome partitioning protein
MASHLANLFSTKVKMTCNDKGQGKITIAFRNDQELQNIVTLLDKVER